MRSIGAVIRGRARAAADESVEQRSRPRATARRDDESENAANSGISHKLWSEGCRNHATRDFSIYAVVRKNATPIKP